MARRDKLRRMMGVNDKGKPTKRPALPPADDEGFNDAVRETLEQLQGQRGDELDQAVTFRDLEDGALSKRMVERGIDAGAKIKVGVDDGAMVGGFDSRDDGMPRPTYPYEAENIEANAAYTRIIISWDIPRIGNYAYSEVYRAETDSVSEARLIGSTRSGIYTDVTGGGFTGYYWIKIVNDLGNRSEFAGGVSATTPLDFDVIRDAATSRAWQKNHDYSIYNAVIPTTGVTYIGDDAVVFIAQSGGISGNTEPNWSSITAFGQIINDNGIQWKAVEAAKIPFMIDAETGLTVIEGAAIRKASIKIAQIQEAFIDNLVAAQGTIDIANIGQGNIFDLAIGGKIASKNFNRGRYGFEITENGDAEFNDVTMRGALTNGVINQNNGRITGGQYIDFRRGVYDQYGSETNGDFVLGNIEAGETIEYKWDNDLKRKVLRLNSALLRMDVVPGSTVFHSNTLSSTSKFAGSKVMQGGKGGNFRITGGNLYWFSVPFREYQGGTALIQGDKVQTSIPDATYNNYKWKKNTYFRVGYFALSGAKLVSSGTSMGRIVVILPPTPKFFNGKPVAFASTPVNYPSIQGVTTTEIEPNWNAATKFGDVIPGEYNAGNMFVRLLTAVDASMLETTTYETQSAVEIVKALATINETKYDVLKSTYFFRRGKINIECKVTATYGAERINGTTIVNASIPVIAMVLKDIDGNAVMVHKEVLARSQRSGSFKNTTVTPNSTRSGGTIVTTYVNNDVSVMAGDTIEIRMYYGCIVGDKGFSPGVGGVGGYIPTPMQVKQSKSTDVATRGYSPSFEVKSSNLSILAREADDTVSIK